MRGELQRDDIHLANLSLTLREDVKRSHLESFLKPPFALMMSRPAEGLDVSFNMTLPFLP